MLPSTSPPRLLTLVCAGLCALAAAPLGSQEAAAPALDSALAELRMGRYWHASRALRAAGAADQPSTALSLARAEAGWGNWPAVVRLLSEAEWLEREDDGYGHLLLGLALEQQGSWDEAAAAYEAFLLVAPAQRRDGRIVAMARRARALDRRGDPGAAVAALDPIPDESVVSWMAIELARRAVERGDVQGVLDLLARVHTETAARAAWRLGVDVRLQAGDTAGAARALEEALAGRPEERRSDETAELGLLVLALGDSARAEELLLEAFPGSRGEQRGEAARALFDLSTDREPDLLLDLARALDRAGEGRAALQAYDLAAAGAAAAGGELPGMARVDRARLMSTVASRQNEALEEFRAIREASQDERVGARNLEVWAQMRRRQGLGEQVATLRRWLIEEWPASDQAAEVLWDQGSRADSRGSWDAALEAFGTLASSGSSHARAGQARMRMGQIHIARGDLQAAAEVFDDYLEDFPDGRRWDEAAYWSARTRLGMGDTARATERVDLIKRRDPFSYYAVVGDELLGRAYAVELPPGEAPIEPLWLTRGLERIELLGAAGLEDAVTVEIAALTGRARASSAVTLRLAQALNESGRTLAGIQIGWQLRSDGHPWDRHLAEVIFPFPHREMISREAEEWGVDPLMVAALIRQESAFQADIVSFAGAVGLMQVMPTTGSELARRHGVSGFHESNLRVADVNLHLGAAYFAQMLGRFSGDLPLVLTAYNAGPTRARRWANLPEASDAVVFAEVIPIEETRGYVKSVSRNVALYRALYGEGR